MFGVTSASWMRDSQISPDDKPFVIAGFVVIGLLLTGISFMLDMSALDVWTASIVFLVLVAGSIPIFSWVAKKEKDPWLFGVLIAALIVHLIFSLIRYYVIFVIYNKEGDAGVYHGAGVTFARHFRDGVPIHPIPVLENFPRESQRIGDLTGLIYVVVGPSAYAGFFIFSYFCFWGQVLVVRAFKAAVPEGDYRRLAIMCLFLPSLLFWPSSIGKEALMIGCLGVTIYGGGLLLAPKPRLHGAIYFVAGTLLLLLVRAHVAAMSVAALVLSMVVGLLLGTKQVPSRDSTDTADGSGKSRTSRGRAVRFVGVIVLLGLAVVVSSRMAQQFSYFSDSGDDPTSVLDKTLRQTSIGNSEFAATAITGPTKLPAGVISVLFRPFPWEARNLNSLLAAGESALLICLVIFGWRRIANLPKYAFRRPFLIFCAAYVVAFSIGFSFIGNFGILARQRVQVMPALLVLLCLPPADVSLFGRREREESPMKPDVQSLDRADNVDTATGSGVEGY